MTRTLLTLPDDVIVYSLSFLDPMNIFAYSLSCKTAYRSHFLNEMLWRFLCESTGKLHLQTTSDNWFQTYSFNAIVPDDVHSLEAAIAASKPGSVVVIRGGTNHTLSGCIIDKSLRIEVFPPESIATIVSPPGSKNVKVRINERDYAHLPSFQSSPSSPPSHLHTCTKNTQSRINQFSMSPRARPFSLLSAD